MKRLSLLILLSLLTLHGLSTYGQTPEKGRIAGRVVDAKTGEGLPGVNIMVKGTYYGATSDVRGDFRIERVNPGSYTVDVSLLGYKLMTYTNFRVTAGQTSMINAKLEETVLTLDQDIVVVGEKPLFNIGETQSRRNVEQADIQAAAVQNVQGIVAMQPGVVFSDNEIHIRGSRSYENAYMIDGISVQDPLAGTGFGLQLSPQSIQEAEVITGGYNAEYGQATSGIVNITTREGSDRFSGAFSYRTDHYGLNRDSKSNWNTDIVDLTLGGPEPLTTFVLPALGVQIPGRVSLFGALNGQWSDGYTRWVEMVGADNRPAGYQVLAPQNMYSSIFYGNRYAPRRSNSYSGFLKLTYKPSGVTKFAYSFSQSTVIDQNTQTVQVTLQYVEPNPGYQYLFQYIPDSANTFTQRNTQNLFSWTHTLSTKTFYEIRLGIYTAHVRGDANGKSFDQYIEPQDIVTYPIRYYNVGQDTVGVIPGDGFYDLGSPTSWRDHYTREFTGKIDLTTYFTAANKFKAGVEMRFQEMQMADLYRPWVKPLGFDYDIYSVYPAQGALYAQENITMGGMILNFGLRLDYWFPGKYVDDICRDTSNAYIVPLALRQEYLQSSTTIFGRQMKARLSPRLGISHPVSDNQTLFFSYGYFSKLPRPQFVYSKLARTSVRSNLPVGNPNLNPETTVAYELGLRNQLSGNDVLTVTAYYKDIFDYITERSVRRLNAAGGAQYYTTYLNMDYARVRGVEVEYKNRIGNWFRGGVAGSYSLATGKSSTPNEAAVQLQQGEPENIKENFLIWDRPVQVSMNMTFTVPPGGALFGFGNGVLDDYSLFVRLFYESGKRYTPQIFTGLDPVTGRPLYISDINRQNASVGESWFYIDLNFEKSFDLSFGRLIAGIEVQNLLNRMNSQIVNPVTGRAYEYGDPTPLAYNDPLYPQVSGDIQPFPYSPARYLNPRTVRVSLALRF
jgi:outer membrane receptor protein involved in Fe transport